MGKDIVTQINDLQTELNELKTYKKNVQKFLQKSTNFLDEKTPKKESEKQTDFEKKICEFYGLENEHDKTRWIDIMLNANSKAFWENRRLPNGE